MQNSNYNVQWNWILMIRERKKKKHNFLFENSEAYKIYLFIQFCKKKCLFKAYEWLYLRVPRILNEFASNVPFSLLHSRFKHQNNTWKHVLTRAALLLNQFPIAFVSFWNKNCFLWKFPSNISADLWYVYVLFVVKALFYDKNDKKISIQL